MNLSDTELLKYALENGMIDVDVVKKKIEMEEFQKYLNKHQSKIWQSTDGNWYTYLPDLKAKNGRRMIKRKTREDLDNAIVDYYKVVEGEPYIEEVFYEWANNKLRYGEIKKQSYDRYVIDFKRFFSGTRLDEVRFKYITEDMLEDFIKSSIHDKELTAKQWSGLRILINGIFKFAKKKGYTDISITTFMGDLDISNRSFKRNKKNDKNQVYMDYEVRMIADWIMEQEPSLINYGILLAFQTGLRVGELSALEWSDVNGNILNVNKTEVRYKDENGKYVFEIADTKTEAGEREVLLTKEALLTLRKIRSINPFGQYIFFRDGRRIREHSFGVKMRKICKYLNINPRSMHKARMTYATKLINGNVNEKIIINQMGHTDISTTKQFYYFNNQDVQSAQNQLENALTY